MTQEHTNGSAGLARITHAQSGSIEPENMADLRAFAGAAAASGFFGAKSPEQALMIAMSGRDLGLTYMQAMRAFYVVNGKACLSADGMVAAILASKKAVFFRTVEKTAERCTVTTQRVGDPEPTSFTFSMADARLAKLADKEVWKSYPAAMLAARAKAALARDVYPDVLLGMYDPDEIEPAPVRHVEALTPVSPVVERVDAKPLFDAIAAATTPDALADVSTRIKAATPSLPDGVVKALRAAYGTRKRDLAPRREVPDSDPHNGAETNEMREPGSDG